MQIVPDGFGDDRIENGGSRSSRRGAGSDRGGAVASRRARSHVVGVISDVLVRNFVGVAAITWRMIVDDESDSFSAIVLDL